MRELCYKQRTTYCILRKSNPSNFILHTSYLVRQRWLRRRSMRPRPMITRAAPPRRRNGVGSAGWPFAGSAPGPEAPVVVVIGAALPGVGSIIGPGVAVGGVSL